MAGTPKKRLAKRQHPERQRRARQTLREARTLMMQSQLGDALPPDPVEALNLVMTRSMQHYRFVAIRADEVPAELFFEQTMFGPVVNKWFRLEEQQGNRVADLAMKMIKADLGERMTRIREAEAAVMLASVKRVLERLNLTPEQRALIGPALRAEAAALMGSETTRGRELVAA